MLTNLDELYNAKPKVGMPCTICIGSDSDPAEIVEVKSPKSVIVRSMNYKHVKGDASIGSAEYEYFSDPNGYTQEFTLRKNGKWVTKGSGMNGGLTLGIGRARYYRDPHF